MPGASAWPTTLHQHVWPGHSLAPSLNEAGAVFLCGAGSVGSMLTGHIPSEYPLLLTPSLLIEGSAVVGYLTEATCPHRFFHGWITVPDADEDASSVSAQQMLRDVKAWTGWSQRILADVIGVTHPTVARILAGELPARSPEAVARLHHVRDVVHRLWVLSGRRPRRVNELVSLAKSSDGASVVELLKEQQWSRAYLLALRLRNGAEPEMLAAAPDAADLDATRFVDEASVWV
jgi:transcriptional regulator with XRE-family HTH domain